MTRLPKKRGITQAEADKSLILRPETQKPKEVKASCRIEIDNAHISASLLKNRKLKYVKVNARSICNVYQQRVTLTVEIYKTGKLSNQLFS